MQEPKSPTSIVWSIIWLVVLGSIALWLAAEVLSQIWGWLLLAGLFAVGIWVLVLWLRRSRDRW